MSAGTDLDRVPVFSGEGILGLLLQALLALGQSLVPGGQWVSTLACKSRRNALGARARQSWTTEPVQSTATLTCRRPWCSTFDFRLVVTVGIDVDIEMSRFEWTFQLLEGRRVPNLIQLQLGLGPRLT